MSIENSKSVEKLKNSQIDSKINSLVSQIEWEFKFKWNTLNNLFSFKFKLGQEETINDSQEFRNALIAEIQAKANSWDIISNNDDELNQVKYEALANKIIQIKKLTLEIQSWIEELRAEMLNESFKELQLTSSSLITKWWYSKKTLQKVDNPENFADELRWLLVWIVETFVILGKFWYDLVKDIILSVYHLIELIRWKAEFESNIKI